MLDWTESDYISNEELSDLLAEFDNRLSSGSGHLIGQWLTSGEFAFISILLKKGPEDEDPYEVHGNVKIDDRYSPLWGQEEFGVRWTIKHYLNALGQPYHGLPCCPCPRHCCPCPRPCCHCCPCCPFEGALCSGLHGSHFG